MLGRGDMLFSIPEFTKPKRVQAAFISDSETTKICDFLRMQRPPSYDDEVISQPVQLTGRGGMVAAIESGDDDLAWKDAIEVVINSRKASTSLLQRKLRIGYGRASRLIDIMEERGIVGPSVGSRPREVLVNSLDDVFAQDTSASKDQGDVYDDMPDDEDIK